MTSTIRRAMASREAERSTTSRRRDGRHAQSRTRASSMVGSSQDRSPKEKWDGQTKLRRRLRHDRSLGSRRIGAHSFRGRASTFQVPRSDAGPRCDVGAGAWSITGLRRSWAQRNGHRRGRDRRGCGARERRRSGTHRWQDGFGHRRERIADAVVVRGRGRMVRRWGTVRVVARARGSCRLDMDGKAGARFRAVCLQRPSSASCARTLVASVFCYENGLVTNPSLAGRISTKFVIGAEGQVLSSADDGSDSPTPTSHRASARHFPA